MDVNPVGLWFLTGVANVHSFSRSDSEKPHFQLAKCKAIVWKQISTLQFDDQDLFACLGGFTADAADAASPILRVVAPVSNALYCVAPSNICFENSRTNANAAAEK